MSDASDSLPARIVRFWSVDPARTDGHIGGVEECKSIPRWSATLDDYREVLIKEEGKWHHYYKLPYKVKIPKNGYGTAEEAEVAHAASIESALKEVEIAVATLREASDKPNDETLQRLHELEDVALPKVGSAWIWSPHHGHARAEVQVVEVKWNGEEFWIRSRNKESYGESGRLVRTPEGETWNSLGRWIESTVRI